MLTEVEIADWTRGYRFSNPDNILTPRCRLFLLPHIYHMVKELNFSIILKEEYYDAEK